MLAKDLQDGGYSIDQSAFEPRAELRPKHDLPVQRPQDAEVPGVGRPTVQDLAVVVLPHIAVQVREREFRQVAACHRPRFDSARKFLIAKVPLASLPPDLGGCSVDFRNALFSTENPH